MRAEERQPLLSNESHDGEQLHGATEDNEMVGLTEEADSEVTKPQIRLTSILLPMTIGILLASMDGAIVTTTYVSIGNDLNELRNTTWIATGYLLTLIGFQPLYGKLSDIFGRKTCLLLSYSVFALGCLLCGLSRNILQLTFSRALAGIGGAGMRRLIGIIKSDVVPLGSGGTWQVIANVIWAGGNVVGSLLGGLLADTVGWRWAFLVQIPIALLAMASVSIALNLPQLKPEVGNISSKVKRADFGGVVTLVLFMFCLLFALDRGGDIAWNDKFTISAFIGFAISFVAFVVVETTWAAEPFAPMHIITNRSLIPTYLVNFFSVASVSMMLFELSLYLQAVQGKTASRTSLWLIINMVGGLCGYLSGGLIIHATGKFYWINVVGHALLWMGTMALTLTSGILVTSTVGMFIGLVMLAFWNGSGITTSVVSLIANTGQDDRATATAVSYLFRSFGSVVGLSVGSTLIQGSLRKTLHQRLSGADVEETIKKVRESLRYLDALDENGRRIVISCYDSAIHLTFWVSVSFAVVAFISSSFIKERPIPRRQQK